MRRHFTPAGRYPIAASTGDLGTHTAAEQLVGIANIKKHSLPLNAWWGEKTLSDRAYRGDCMVRAQHFTRLLPACAVDAGWFGPKLPSTPWFWPQPRSAARDNCSGEHDRFRTTRLRLRLFPLRSHTGESWFADKQDR